jgi:hypothetical protein
MGDGMSSGGLEWPVEPSHIAFLQPGVVSTQRDTAGISRTTLTN